ncbi:hypothetical protein B9Z55_004199 [Caenorhabditis nigoni]|uniref:Uncharacterized protein n=1 Tax=Caenorhabditis nigoni TaxID=1611254 RepID=A0A2G5UVC7_9PELO|nr:hypothetical protein B9Z55_004199 [Caenorhabditis nigoni]
MTEEYDPYFHKLFKSDALPVNPLSGAQGPEDQNTADQAPAGQEQEDKLEEEEPGWIWKFFHLCCNPNTTEDTVEVVPTAVPASAPATAAADPPNDQIPVVHEQVGEENGANVDVQLDTDSVAESIAELNVEIPTKTIEISEILSQFSAHPANHILIFTNCTVNPFLNFSKNENLCDVVPRKLRQHIREKIKSNSESKNGKEVEKKFFEKAGNRIQYYAMVALEIDARKKDQEGFLTPCTLPWQISLPSDLRRTNTIRIFSKLMDKCSVTEEQNFNSVLHHAQFLELKSMLESEDQKSYKANMNKTMKSLAPIRKKSKSSKPKKSKSSKHNKN